MPNQQTKKSANKRSIEEVDNFEGEKSEFFKRFFLKILKGTNIAAKRVVLESNDGDDSVLSGNKKRFERIFNFFHFRWCRRKSSFDKC